MHVLFASGIDGFCHRYAVLHWAEQLATRGIAATVRAHLDPRLAGDLVDHDLLVLYRVPSSPWIARLIEWAHARGRPTVFAIDDLIFDPDVPEPPLLGTRSDDDRRAWHEGVRRYRTTLLACRVFLGTTPALCAHARAAGKSVHLHRAGLGAVELALGARARARDAGGARLFRLGYFSGTPTHDDDFATIAPVIADLLERHPGVELLVGGEVTLAPVLARFGARILRLPLVPWAELPTVLASVDVNLAPLAWEHPFVAAKGAIKYLEAAAVGVPTVASPTEAFRDAITDGANGVLAADAAAWHEALTTLITDPARAGRLGAAAREDVGRRFDPVTQGEALASMLHHCLERKGPAGGVGTAPAPADELTIARSFPEGLARTAREPHALPDVATPAAIETTMPLADRMLLAQAFVPRRRGLLRVDVHTITYGQTLDHELEIRLRRDDGLVVASERMPAALVPNGDWLALAVPTQDDSAGRTYTLELEARGTGPGNALSFGVAARADDWRPFVLDGAAGTGTLAIRTFAAADTRGADAS
jgi:glycosyltransferase involved in cell wall biosynthesis